MAYDTARYEDIVDRMLDRIADSIDKREGSLTYNSIAQCGAELKEVYIQLENIMNETFVDTCSRPYLLKRLSERGLYPNPATKSILKCVVTPSTLADSSIIGARFSIDDLNYTCIEFTNPVTRDGLLAGEFKLQCETAGDVGNYPIGSLTVIGSEIIGLQSATIPNNAVIIHGDDEESTESCRQKYYASLTTTAFGGNINDYKNKIKDSASMGATVGAVKVFPNTSPLGETVGGFVEIEILDADLNLASSTLIATIQNKIDPFYNGNGGGIAPIGHKVNISTTTATNVYVNLTGTLQTGVTFADIEDDVIAQINDYINSVKVDWEDETSLWLNAQELHSYIKNVNGFSNFTVKFTDSEWANPVDSLQITENKIPALGDVKFTEV